MFLTSLNTEIAAQELHRNCATSRIWKVLPNMIFPSIWGEKNGGVLSTRMQVILDSLFARPGSAPIGGGNKGELRDRTSKFLDWNYHGRSQICLDISNGW